MGFASSVSMRFLTLAVAGCLAAAQGCDNIGARPETETDASISPVGDGGKVELDGGPSACPEGMATLPIHINEVVTDNDGVWVDELGEADDFIEIVNTSSKPVRLDDYSLTDDSHDPVLLFGETLEPGEAALFWADNELSQGRRHLPFKLSSSGDALVLSGGPCEVVERVKIPALPLNESYARLPDGKGAFVPCQYATPKRMNGKVCEPPAPPSLPNDLTFEAYTWPETVPEVVGPLVLTELALKPATFIEVLNISEQSVTLGDYQVRVAATGPGLAFPTDSEGVLVPWSGATLGAGKRMLLPVDATLTAALEASPEFEGVVTLFGANAQVVDRVDFMHWPANAALTRAPESSGQLRFCKEVTPGKANTDCDPIAKRDVGDRLHHLRTPQDFEALAAGGSEVGLQALKFAIDMEAGDVVHLLSEHWALHYTFVREQIYKQPALDRCDPAQAREFRTGWGAFSDTEYFRVEGRRFLLGTLVKHASGLHTVEFTNGDVISPAQMRRAFFTVVAHTDNPKEWSLRPEGESQVERMRVIEGTVPIVGPNAPFVNLKYQPLTPAVGYGDLTFVSSEQLENTQLGPHTLVVTDAVPNDLPFVGGLITEAFQTPLAHINVLSRARGTPNMALRDARNHARIKPFFGKLVRLEVGPADFKIRQATAAEADAFWKAHTPSGPVVVPPLDDTMRGVQDLTRRGIADLPAIGAKAAQFAELYKITKEHSRCNGGVPLNVPEKAFAIPVVHYLEHFKASGAEALLSELLKDPEFRADSKTHLAGLAAVRDKMLKAPVDPTFLSTIERAVRDRFGNARVRFRSSSNTEDLPTFNGAGLHTSASVELDDDQLGIEDGLRTVWSSLWNARAFDEREFANIDQTRAAMAVLAHEASEGEAAQGVAISRNMLDITRSSVFTVNAQIGEASVTNPAPGVVTEQLLYSFPPRKPEVAFQSRSSLTEGEPVLTLSDTHKIVCAVGAVSDHFRPLLDPQKKNQHFAMQIEFKIERDKRKLVVKQARPQPIVAVDIPQDCREF